MLEVARNCTAAVAGLSALIGFQYDAREIIARVESHVVLSPRPPPALSAAGCLPAGGASVAGCAPLTSEIQGVSTE